MVEEYDRTHPDGANGRSSRRQPKAVSLPVQAQGTSDDNPPAGGTATPLPPQPERQQPRRRGRPRKVPSSNTNEQETPEPGDATEPFLGPPSPARHSRRSGLRNS